MSKTKNIDFLEKYLRELEKWYLIVGELCSCDFITPEKILSGVPTKAKQEKWLINKAESLAKNAKKTKSHVKANHFAKYAKLLSDPNVRSKHAECLVVRKKRVAERRIEDLSKPNAKAKRAAQLANDNGFDGGMFFKTVDDPTSLQSIRNLSKQKETIPQIIAAIEKPKDRSIIPEGVELLTVPQVARLLGWGESVVRQRNNEGLLPTPLRFGGTIQWYKKELENWIKHGCPPREKWEKFKKANREQTHIEED